jgi:hypothetical protein
MMPSDAAFPGATDARLLPATSHAIPSGLDEELLRFVTEMNGVQLDQLADLVADRGGPADQTAEVARALVALWGAAGYAESGQLSLGEPWVWATRKGLDACGLRTRVVKPSEKFLRHTHALTDVRLALERTPAWRENGLRWRSERSIRSDLGFPARTQHVADGEVHWPAGSGLPWAGKVWAVEVELSPKSVAVTTQVMHEVLTQTVDSGGVAAGMPAPTLAPRYAGLVYVCSPKAVRTVLNARAEVGSPLSARISVYDLPASATRLNTPKRGWQS